MYVEYNVTGGVLVISPDDLINEVKPWDAGSWRAFLEGHIVSARALADTVANNLRNLEYVISVGIRAIPVILGRLWSYRLLVALLYLPYILVVPLTTFNILPLLTLITLVVAIKSYNLVKRFGIEISEDADSRVANITLQFDILFLVLILLGEILGL